MPKIDRVYYSTAKGRIIGVVPPREYYSRHYEVKIGMPPGRWVKRGDFVDSVLTELNKRKYKTAAEIADEYYLPRLLMYYLIRQSGYTVTEARYEESPEEV